LHVAYHNRRIAGDVTAEMTRQQPRIGVGAAAGIEPHDQIDALAAVERGRILRRRNVAQRRRDRRSDQQRANVYQA
jgi:hypothetical protein